MQSQKDNIIHQGMDNMLLWKHKVFYLQAATYPWTQLTKALDCFSNTVQLMTATAVRSLQISGSYSCIMRLAIYCYTETLKRHRRKLSLGCVLPKTLQRGTLLCQPEETIPKTWGWPGCSPTLRVTKRIHSSARLQHTGALHEKADLIPRKLLFTWMPPL